MAISISLNAGANIREMLQAARTYYVRTDGSDSNNGLTNTAGGAFATFNKALTAIAALDCNGFNLTIQGNNATHTDQVNFSQPIMNAGEVILDCAGGTISTTNQSAILFNFGIVSVVQFVVQNVTLTTATAGNCIEFAAPALFQIGTGVTFGACAENHFYVHSPAVLIFIGDNYTISGSAERHLLMYSTAGASFNFGSATITLTGTPAFSQSFIDIRYCCVAICGGVTFSGAATGSRYNVVFNGMLDTNAGGANFFPGNSAGFSGFGGTYF